MLVTQISASPPCGACPFEDCKWGFLKNGGKLFTTRDALGWVLLRDYRLITLINSQVPGGCASQEAALRSLLDRELPPSLPFLLYISDVAPKP